MVKNSAKNSYRIGAEASWKSMKRLPDTIRFFRVMRTNDPQPVRMYSARELEAKCFEEERKKDSTLSEEELKRRFFDKYSFVIMKHHSKMTTDDWLDSATPEKLYKGIKSFS